MLAAQALLRYAERNMLILLGPWPNRIHRNIGLRPILLSYGAALLLILLRCAQ